MSESKYNIKPLILTPAGSPPAELNDYTTVGIQKWVDDILYLTKDDNVIYTEDALFFWAVKGVYPFSAKYIGIAEIIKDYAEKRNIISYKRICEIKNKKQL